MCLSIMPCLSPFKVCFETTIDETGCNLLLAYGNVSLRAIMLISHDCAHLRVFVRAGAQARGAGEAACGAG